LTRAGDRLVLARTALVTVAVTFFLMDSLTAAYGPLLEHLARRFEVSLSGAGAALSAHYAGAVVGVVASMWALERLPSRHAVGAALVCLGFGWGGVALAPSWIALLAGVFVIAHDLFYPHRQLAGRPGWNQPHPAEVATPTA